MMSTPPHTHSTSFSDRYSLADHLTNTHSFLAVVVDTLSTQSALNLLHDSHHVELELERAK